MSMNLSRSTFLLEVENYVFFNGISHRAGVNEYGFVFSVNMGHLSMGLILSTLALRN